MKVPWSDREWGRVLVYGLGVSGTAVARFLDRRGVRVLAVDDRDPGALELDDGRFAEAIEIVHAPALEALPEDVDGVVVSPGVPADRPLLVAAAERGLPVIGEIELAFPFLRAPVIAITGSNGKSTTAAMTGAIIDGSGRRAIVCGNFGRPLIDCVDEGSDALVVEVSSFQLLTVDRFHPVAAALLNLSPDHLDRHGDLAAYAAAKARIFARQGGDDVAVLNGDDGEVERSVGSLAARTRRFSRRRPLDDGCFVDDGAVVEVEPGEAPRLLFAVDDLPVPGDHNLENAMASALLARAIGVDDVAVGLRGFHGLPHRLQRVRERRGVVWFDDSKGTNVGATAKSLAGFADGSVHLILGGRSKGASAAPLADTIRRKAARLYLVGEAAAQFAGELDGTAPLERSGDLPTAIASAARQAAAGEVVLLSPACASFDQYTDFAARGEHFQALVRALPEGSDG